MTDSQEIFVRKLTTVLGIRVESTWNDDVTHFVVRTAGNGTYNIRSTYYFNAIVSNCPVVNLQWVRDCLSKKSLRPAVRNISI